MNKDKVIELAKEQATDNLGSSYFFWPSDLYDFAAAIRDQTLEEAARVCSRIAYSELLKNEVGECGFAAMQIRALKSGDKK